MSTTRVFSVDGQWAMGFTICAPPDCVLPFIPETGGFHGGECVQHGASYQHTYCGRFREMMGGLVELQIVKLKM